jgi:hypothetical protein
MISLLLGWLESSGGGIVAHPAGHHLDNTTQRLLHWTPGDCSVAFQHIEHLGLDITEDRTGHRCRHDRSSHICLHGGFAFKQVDTARCVFCLVHQPDLPAQTGYVGNRLSAGEPCRFQIGFWNAELHVDLQNFL